MELNSLQDVLLDQLADLRSAEQQLVAALPKAASAAHSPELREAFSDHLEQTRVHVERLGEVCRQIGMTPPDETCEAMQGILREGDEVMAATGDPAAKDAALIAAAQRVEHYEIAGYGTAHALADELGFGEAAGLLKETLDEEADADKRLTKIATGGLFSGGINAEAMA
jgi:ferritin-like metal-binding protein YciE